MRTLLAAIALAVAFVATAQPADAQLLGRRYVFAPTQTWTSSYLRYRAPGRTAIYPNSFDSNQALLYLLLTRQQQDPAIAALASPNINRQLALHLLLNRQTFPTVRSTNNDALQNELLILLLNRLESPCNGAVPALDPIPEDL